MNLETELEALNDNLLADTRIIYVTRKQVGGINGLLSMGLEDTSSDMRHAVLNMFAGRAMKRIAGVDVNSATNLTSPVASFLINLLKEDGVEPWQLSEYGRELISLAENNAKVRAI